MAGMDDGEWLYLSMRVKVANPDQLMDLDGMDMARAVFPALGVDEALITDVYLGRGEPSFEQMPGLIEPPAAHFFPGGVATYEPSKWEHHAD